MRDAIRVVLATLLLLAGIGIAEIRKGAAAADSPTAMHGSADAFSAAGVTLAWGVLRGATEAATVVIVRIAVDRDTFTSAAVSGIDPFAQRQHTLLPATPIGTGLDVRVPRAHFADFPRTEVHLFRAADATGTAAPALIVFFLGVPDTTPEFASAAALEAYLTQRIAHARAGTRGKTP